MRLMYVFVPMLKTTKCLPIVLAQIEAGAQGITVSTLKEAEEFFDKGIKDILYAVGIVPSKLPQVLSLQQRGCDLKIIVDNVAAAQAIGHFGKAHGAVFDVLIEIDTDGHRSGVKPEDDALLDIAQALNESGMRLGGVLTHAGASYGYDTHAELLAISELERSGATQAAQRIREAGLDCPVITVGSTPTALKAEHLEGVTELRAGVYAFHDLVMKNIGVCDYDDIALSILTTVIGHQKEKGWVIVDAGWMAMSRDRGTQNQKHDYGYGQVCNEDGDVIEGLIMNGANQEHGILHCDDEPNGDIEIRFPVGTRLRILPNHACATAAQYPNYQALMPDGSIETWQRFYGW